MNTYTAAVTRSGKWWAIEVLELDGVYSQARRLEQVEATTRDAIAATLDVTPDSFAVTVTIDLPREIEDLITTMRACRAEAEEAAERAASCTRNAVKVLHDSGLPMRDVGQVLGVSHQRVHQLISR